jgi:transcriptional regulator with XRE-family HTH domain
VVFGQRLQDLRRRAGLSQEEVAHRARLHATYLSDLERGTQTPTLDVVNRLATALRVTLAELFVPLDRRFRSRQRKERLTCGCGPLELSARRPADLRLRG